ncbi:hypothetical protein HHK36_002003 [Tetracentron sinense]|uniref:ABC1 atypical kinase-like domain-containing protein n=1 Tax=Tetracentron sinense TaxID=13715 RepID=A0A834ZUD4_TETSI|nr:hypothetical protein HHK36_002003 [Tetracentron sinense]
MPVGTVHHLCILDGAALRKSNRHVKVSSSVFCFDSVWSLEVVFLAFGNIRRVAHSLLANQRISCSEIKNHGALVTVGLPSSLCKVYSQYKVSTRGHASFTLFKAKENFYSSSYSKNFSVFSASKMTHHAQVARRRLSQICSYNGPTFPPISRIACAVCLALTRSNLVVPSVLACIIGELAWTQRTWADGEHFPTRNTLYMHAQDGHAYFTSFVLSVLEAFILFLRVIYLTILFSPSIAMAPFADCLGVEFRKTWLHVVHLTLEKGGPAFIKWGQWAATRPDLFPRDLCTELAKLHTKAPAHSFAYTKRTIEKAFGRKLPEIFENFEESPVASGSVAQVHRASLRFRYPGQKVKPIVVAVKVRHPGVGEAIRRDFVIINLVAKISKFMPTLKWLRLDESVQQFSVFMMSQVDLAREAAHLGRFNYNFRRWKNLSFPKPLYPLVHPAVLVETYEQGESVSYYVDELEGNDRIKSAVAHIGTHALLKMLLRMLLVVLMGWCTWRGEARAGAAAVVKIVKASWPRNEADCCCYGSGAVWGLFWELNRGYFGVLDAVNRGFQAAIEVGLVVSVDNFIHADMHPGNILVRVAQSKSSRKLLFKKSRPHVIFLDVGMTAELSKSDRVNLLEFFKAVAVRDGRTAAECTLRLSKQQNCPDPKAFIEEMEESFSFWGSPEGDVVHPAECMQQLLEKVRYHKVNVDGNVCTVLVSFLVLEGWQRKLDPEYNVMHTLQTLLFKADWAQSLSYTIEGLMAP